MKEKLKERTKTFAINVIKLIQGLPRNKEVDVLTNQLLRSATSVGANYRAACRARSQANFISKITIVEEEADECCYWLELMIECKLGEEKTLCELKKEANELTAIFTASGKTAKNNRVKKQ